MTQGGEVDLAEVAVYKQIHSPYPVDPVQRDWHQRMMPALTARGFLVQSEIVGAIQYRRRYTPGGAILIAILLFPIGLLALLAKREDRLSVRFEQGRRGTRATITGTMPRDLWNQFEQAFADDDAATFEPMPTPAPPPPPPAQPPHGFPAVGR